jgi:hypothetical protein
MAVNIKVEWLRLDLPLSRKNDQLKSSLTRFVSKIEQNNLQPIRLAGG